jgi:hypothetical protein
MENEIQSSINSEERAVSVQQKKTSLALIFFVVVVTTSVLAGGAGYFMGHSRGSISANKNTQVSQELSSNAQQKDTNDSQEIMALPESLDLTNTLTSQGFYIWKHEKPLYSHFTIAYPSDWKVDEFQRFDDSNGRSIPITIDSPIRMDMGEGITNEKVSMMDQNYPVGVVSKEVYAFKSDDGKTWFEGSYSLVEAAEFSRNDKQPLMFINYSAQTEEEKVEQEAIIEKMLQTLQLVK